MVKKVVIIGPESTGKSTLCEMLARHFNTLWCPEFAREYLLKNGNKYNFDDLLTIAKGQLALEDEYERMVGAYNPSEKTSQTDALDTIQPVNYSTSQLLFIDTDQYVMKVWSEYVFGDCHNWILRRIAERPYDLYLLCKPDLPWVKDELREYPDEKPRQELYHIYRDILLNQPVSWAEISGSYNQRFELARNAVMAVC
jgi:NadR type nicotinamide-nucleotide adenylyltransferase